MTALFFFLFFLVLYTYIVFPALLTLIAYTVPSLVRPGRDIVTPHISIAIIVHNGEQIIADKLTNCLALDYPPNHLEIIVFSDGSTDRTGKIVRDFQSFLPILLLENDTHQGKNFAIRSLQGKCSGDIVIMTDASSMFNSQAVSRIVQWFTEDTVGGVCGRKQFTKADTPIEHAQTAYLSYEDHIRNCESRIASIASNEGFFYAIRRELMQPIPDGVTDDLYIAMSVIRRGFRFLYDPRACASLPIRARSPAGELVRRRRIVCGSLSGIVAMKALLNPIRFPLYSWILFSHKIIRRLVPVLLLFLIAVTLVLAFDSALFLSLFLLQMTGVSVFTAQHFHLLPFSALPWGVKRLASTWYYFCLGNWGTFLGLIDLIRGVKYSKWTPSTPEQNSKR